MDSLCAACGKSYATRKALYEHKSKIHGKKTIYCSDCGYKSKSRSNMSRHKSSVNSQCNKLEKPKSIECNVCNIVLKNQRVFKKHVKMI